MTYFEELASKLGVLEQNEKGFYTGKCKTLYYISVDVMLSEDEEILKLSDKEKEKIIIERFYKKFPQLKAKEKQTGKNMKVKDFLSVCAFEPMEIKDLSGNIYLLNGQKYAHYEDMKILKVTNKCGYITIYLKTYGYDGEYKPV